MASTYKIVPAFTHNATEDLGGYTMPHLIKWWVSVRAEHNYHYQKIAELQAKMRKTDQEIGPVKRREGPQAAGTKRLIRQRRSYHKKVKPWEAHILTLKRQLASFDRIFDSAIEPYSRASSLSLTAALYTEFPRELRDMVYAYLLEPPVRANARQTQQHYEAIVSSGPVFLDLEFVHGEVVSEMMHMVEKKKKTAAQKLHPGGGR